jgi:hypothetical protein
LVAPLTSRRGGDPEPTDPSRTVDRPRRSSEIAHAIVFVGSDSASFITVSDATTSMVTHAPAAIRTEDSGARGPLAERAYRRIARAARRASWGLAVTLVTGLLLAFLYGTSPRSHSPGSDGHYMWLFARSMVFDHDVDFRNDFELCGDPQHWGSSPETGRANNPFYVGPAVAWAPILGMFRLIVRFAPDAPADVTGGCRGPLTRLTLWTGPLLGTLTVWLMYRTARRRTGDGPAAFTAGLLALGTPLAKYAALSPSYSHAYDAFWAAVSMLAALRAAESPRSLARWALAGAAIGVGLLQRPVSVAYGIVPAVLAIATLRGEWGLLAASLGVLGVNAFACGLVPQMLVNHASYGVWWRGPPNGPLFMQYGHAHPWLLLFAPHGGLFLTAPVVWLALPGAIAGAWDPRTRALVVSLFVATAVTIWVSSAALDWHASGTFGARRLTSLAPLFAIPLAITIEGLRRWLRAKPRRAMTSLATATLVAIACTITGAGYAQSQGKLPTDVGVSEAELYGAGERMAWSAVEDQIGALSILPAELLFQVRYGLPGKSFRPATEPVFQRNSLTLGWPHDTLDLADKGGAGLTTGFESGTSGGRMVRSRATVVVASEWPYATGLYVRAHADRPTGLRVGSGRAFGHVLPYGVLPLDTKETTARLDVPEGGFDSGVNEFVFERDDPAAVVTVSSLRIEDTQTVLPR